jgi:broad specificity phosphatase PhoE
MEALFFIRHAETDLAGRFCGQANPIVNKQGLRQIEELVNVLRNESIEAVYSSDLARALITAEALGRAFGVSPVAIPDLREIDFGEWEGLNWAEIESRDPAYARRWAESYPDLPAPGGELFAAFRSRTLSAVERLLAAPSERGAAVVTHSGVMRVVLRSLCGLDEQTAWERTRTYCGYFRYEPGRAI